MQCWPDTVSWNVTVHISGDIIDITVASSVSPLVQETQERWRWCGPRWCWPASWPPPAPPSGSGGTRRVTRSWQPSTPAPRRELNPWQSLSIVSHPCVTERTRDTRLPLLLGMTGGRTGLRGSPATTWRRPWRTAAARWWAPATRRPPWPSWRLRSCGGCWWWWRPPWRSGTRRSAPQSGEHQTVRQWR